MSKPEPDSDLVEDTAAPPSAQGARHLPVVQDRPVAPPPPRSSRRVWVWGLGASMATALAVVLYLQPWAAGPVPVYVEIAGYAPVTRVLAVNGRIAALHSVDVRALASGPLVAVQIAEGQPVLAGTELARIDAEAQRAVLRQAVAGLDAALVAQDQAVTTLARSEALGQNVARTALDNATSGVRAAAQEVARMTALVDQAQIQLANFTVLAPIAGTVLSLNVDPGQTVDPATVLLTLADLRQLVVETDVDEAYATQIRTGLPTVLQLAGEGTTRTGRVSFVSQRIDAATGGLGVKLSFDTPVNAPVGLTVTANIIIDQQGAALTAPRTAIQSTGAENSVFVVIEGIATRRVVAVIDWPAPRLIVTKGLAPGDAVILDASGISDGQAVRVDQP